MLDKDPRIMVSISCITVNHAPYIKKCLDSFLMQKCDFNFEVLIHDDASTDGTREIIKEYQGKYPDIIKPIFQTENQWSKGVRGIMARFNFPRAKGKYIALCEGDDYWTDPLKLQKQVEFLEKNEEFGSCFHRYSEIENENIVKHDLPEIDADFVIDKKTFFDGWYTKTLTSLIRKEDLLNIDLFKYKNFRDSNMFYELLNIRKSICLNFNGGVYRRHHAGIWSPLDDIEKNKQSYFLWEHIFYFNQGDEKLKEILKAKIQKMVASGFFKSNLELFKQTKSIYFKKFIFKCQMKKYFDNILK